MLSDNRKWFIGLFVGVVIAIVGHFSTTSEKMLTYKVSSITELISSDVSADEISINISGENVSSASIFTIRIINSGDTPILKSDFERPLYLEFEEKEKIYSVKIKNKLPDDLPVLYKVVERKVHISSLLINPDDEFEIEVIASSTKAPEIKARIAGVSSINSLMPKSKTLLKIVLGYSLVFVFAVLFFRMAFLCVTGGVYFSNPYVKAMNVFTSMILFSMTYDQYELLTGVILYANISSEWPIWLSAFFVGLYLSSKDVCVTE